MSRVVAPEAPNLSAKREDDDNMGGEVAQRDISDAESISGDEIQAPQHRNSPSDLPSREIEHHVLTGHASFRSWCAACVQGRERGQAEGHREESHEEVEQLSKIPVSSWDYFSLGQESNQQGRERFEQRGESPVLLMHDGMAKSIFGHLVPGRR